MAPGGTAAILTLTGKYGLIPITMEFELAGEPVIQVSEDVIWQ